MKELKSDERERLITLLMEKRLLDRTRSYSSISDREIISEYNKVCLAQLRHSFDSPFLYSNEAPNGDLWGGRYTYDYTEESDNMSEDKIKVEEETLEGWLGTDAEMCKDIAVKKYFLPASIIGHDETVSEFLDRVSMGDPEVRKLIYDRKFIPGGRILANMDLPKYGIKCTYSNCYVNKPPKDNIESIYKRCGNVGRTFSYGGGVGIDISTLAPKGAKVNNVANDSSGAVSFISTYSQVSETIGMRNRRGALMVSINDTHPDLPEFITYKDDLNIATGCNMSIRVSDAFMEHAKAGTDNWELSFTRPESGETISRVVNPKELLSRISEMNWKQGEPGILFWDNINNYNLMANVPWFEYAGVNPCAEECLPAGGACLLGAMNISEYYRDREFKFDEFANDVKIAVRYLDNVLEAGRKLHPLKVQRKTVADLRQVGLGIMGLADLLIKANMTYGSEKSLEFVDAIGYVMAFSAIDASSQLAAEKGPFKKCTADVVSQIVSSDFFKHNVLHNPYVDRDDILRVCAIVQGFGLRNSQLLTCAPTGTTSTILNVSGGIEPMFALEYTRRTKLNDTQYTVYPKIIKEYMKEYHKDDPKELPFEWIVTARDIDYHNRLKMQATWQKHIDASISSTVNLPESATPDDIFDLYITAWELGLKGVTVFRENCKRAAILTDASSEKKTKETADRITPDNDTVTMEAAIGRIGEVNKNKRSYGTGSINMTSTYGTTATDSSDTHIFKDRTGSVPDQYKLPPIHSFERIVPSPLVPVVDGVKIATTSDQEVLTRAELGRDLPGRTVYTKVACGHLYITINRYKGRPVEVFINSSKSGGCTANANALGRMASLALRCGIDPELIVDAVLGVKCASCSAAKGKGEVLDGISCADVMARVIREEWNNYVGGAYDSEKEDTVSIKVEEKRPAHISHKPSTGECVECEGSCTGPITSIVNNDSCESCSVESPAESPKNIHVTGSQDSEPTMDSGMCPDCGAGLIMSEGCLKCIECGYSRC